MARRVEEEHGYIDWHSPSEYTKVIQPHRNILNDAGRLVRNMAEVEPAGNGWTARQHRARVNLPARSDAPVIVTSRRLGIGYSLRPQGRPGRSGVFVNRRRIVYPDVWPDVDLIIGFRATGPEFFFEIKGPQAPQNLDFDLNPLGPNAVFRERDGQVFVFNQTTRQGYKWTTPVGDDGREGRIDARTRQGTIRFTLPDLSRVSFPYTVDPATIEVGQGSGTMTDGYAFRSAVDETWATIRDAAGTGVDNASTTMRSRLVTSTTSGQFTEYQKPLLNFDVGANGGPLTPGATVVSATLEIKLFAKTNAFATSPGYDLVVIEGDNDLAGAILAQSYEDSAQGGSSPAWSDAHSLDSWAAAASRTFTFNAAGLAGLPNNNSTAQDWSIALAIKELESDGQTAAWESSVQTLYQFHSQEAASSTDRPLLTVNYVIQPVVTYFTF